MITSAKILIGGAIEYFAMGIKIPRGDAKYIMSRSELVRFAECPRKWKLGGFDGQESSFLDHGSLVDTLLLSPDSFESTYAVLPEEYPSEVKATKKEMLSDDYRPATEMKKWTRQATFCKEYEQRIEAEGKSAIKSVELNTAYSAIRRLNEDAVIREIVQNSAKQVIIAGVWLDEFTGIEIPIKCMIDLAPHQAPFLADLKTTSFAEPRKYARQVIEKGYHIQAALYLDLWNAARPDDQREEFRHIVSESSTPFEPAKYGLSVELIELGRERYKSMLASYACSLASNLWAGYDNTGRNGCIQGWLTLEPPSWALMQEMAE